MNTFLIVGLMLVIIAFGPLATIWSINTLFLTAIPLNFTTWFASMWLGAVVYGSTKK